MIHSGLPIRLSVFAKILIVSAVIMQSPVAASAANIKVSYDGTLSSDPSRTVAGFFLYDDSKPNDAGSPRKFTYTGDAFFQHNFSCSGDVSLPTTPVAATYVLQTNIDNTTFKKIQLTVKTGGKTYVLLLNTPNAINPATKLPDCSQYPVPSGSSVPGTGTLKVTDSGGTTNTYNIKVTGCM